ncbi:hypothetical protein [Burkholderia cepacia]|uniref:hypothetical protein n=1 Tax=Burkholderia cepacia TaxID=292 RepID=UPI0012D9C410|nr:hypothetical protein [Burkholderia cepacia]
MLLFVGVHDAGSARFVAGRVMPGRSSARFACTQSRQRGKNAYRIGCRPAFPATIRAFSPCRSPTARSARAAAIAKPTKLDGSDGTIAQPSIESRERGLPGFARAASAQACTPRQSPAQTRRFNSGNGSNRQNETSLPIIYSPNIRIPIPAFIKSHNLPTQ